MMASLQDLLDFIKKNPPGSVSWSDWSWEHNLTETVPNWRDIVQNPDNWPAIEQVRPRRYLYDLCKLLVDTVGAKLVKRWLRSSVKEQINAVRHWLKDLNNLNADIWNELTDEMKEYVLYYYFDRFPGEPFESMSGVARAIEHLAHEKPFAKLPVEILPPVLPITGYVPSTQISRLRSIIERAGDKRSLKRIDEMIAQRERACEIGATRSVFLEGIPYTPTCDERELIARVMDRARASGFRPAALPPIVLSFETPPFFVSYPELEDDEESKDEQERGEVPRNRQRSRPETISIEEVLGCYRPDPRIILYARGLRWYAKEKGIDEDLLRAVVLVHEVGHWVTHLLSKPGLPEWPLDLYKLTEEEVHEGWAQLITWWVADEVRGKIKKTFEELNKSQPAPYRVFEKFKSIPVNSVMASLERLRQLRLPARLSDWERFCL